MFAEAVAVAEFETADAEVDAVVPPSTVFVTIVALVLTLALACVLVSPKGKPTGAAIADMAATPNAAEQQTVSTERFSNIAFPSRMPVAPDAKIAIQKHDSGHSRVN
jgi:hypothetical protein